MSAICRTLQMARRTAYHVSKSRPEGFYRRADDETVLRQIRSVTNSRASYGTRRTRAMVNEACRTKYGRHRIRRIMRLNGLMLAPRVHRRHGRPHLGQVQQPASNQRWCSDIFLIPCWSGEVVSVAFVIDCHDREVLAHVAAPRSLKGADIRALMERSLWRRFGEAALRTPHSIQWLSDNGPPVHGHGERVLCSRARLRADHDAGVQPAEQRPRRSVREDSEARLRGGRGSSRRRVRALTAHGMDRGLQHPGAPFGARHAEPGRLPGSATT